jgi:predicted double-glycine peptidase
MLHEVSERVLLTYLLITKLTNFGYSCMSESLETEKMLTVIAQKLFV